MFKASKVLFIISVIFAVVTGIALPQIENNKKLYTVQSISIYAPTRTLEVGYYTELSTTITPSTATVSSDQISWNSSNTYVATVSYGRVTAKNPGTTTITATTPNGKKASCVFTITAKVTGISLNYTTYSLAKGDSFTLTPTISPSNASNKNITWSSSNTSIATVSNGVVTGIAGGSATITATTNNNLYASCSVTVSNNATTYAISYTLNGGTNSSSNPTSYTKLDTITLSQPTKTGYTFKGWTGSNGSTPQTYVSIPKGSSGSKNYTANWTANSYNISYVLSEGNFGSYHPTTLIYDSSSTISNPTKAYATFTGWTITGMDSVTHTYGSSTTTSTSITSTKETNYKNLRSTSGTVTFTANWSYTNYSISYNLGGGTNNSLNPSKYTYYDSITLGVPTRNGYNFIGWTGSNGTTPQTSVSISKYSTGNKTYTANWELATYSITYNLNGGDVNGTNPASYTLNSSSITLINPTKYGYTFAGWTGSNGTAKQTSVTIASGSYGNKSYTANWTPIQYSITYNLNGGSNNSPNYTNYTIETVRTIYSPSRNGYRFLGWTGSNGDVPEMSVAIAKGSTGNKTYTANWEIIIYNITYVLNNGTVVGLNPATYTIEDDDIIFVNPTKDYYAFNYWSNAYCYNPNNKEYGIKKGTYGDKTITAYWTPINYTITYDLDGGTVSSTNKTSYNIETNTFTLNNPTKAGFEFVGWSGTELTGNNNKNVQITKGEHGDRQYTANWQANQYTIKFVTNCASQLDDLTLDCGSLLSLPKPVWSGKSLEGWYRDENLTIKFDLQAMPAFDLILYAKWISYDITISPNELTAISINAELTPAGINATAIDTDGDSLELALTTSGTFAVGETILIRLSTTGKYSTAKQKTYNEVKVYGMPEFLYNTTKDYINITDELVPELFSAVGTDTFGGNTTNTLYVKEENYSAGDKVTIVIKYVDVAGNERIVEIPNIKVYGEPILVCNTDKVKACESYEPLKNELDIIAQDSFGNNLDYTIEVQVNYDDYKGIIDSGQKFSLTSKNPSIVTFTACSTDIYKISQTGSVFYSSQQGSNCKCSYIYKLYDVTNDVFVGNIGSPREFNVIGGNKYKIEYYLSFTSGLISYSSTVSFEIISQNKTYDITLFNLSEHVGEIFTFKYTTIDNYGNQKSILKEHYICGTPTISDPIKTLFKDTEIISYETLGITSKDSFNDEITNVSIQLVSGQLVAGQTLEYLVTATDSVGNQAQKTISNIKVYGIPTITYNTDKKGIKVTDNINANLFSATAKDSFNNNLTVQAEIYSGIITAGQSIKIKFTTTDCVGNIKEVITDYIGVYSVNDITLTYNQYLSDYIKLTSKGEEFNAVAKDSFNNNIDIKVVATTGTLAGGNVISLKLVATDKAGNIKESDIITNIKVYGIPSINCNLERVYLYETADNIELYIVAVDSFNDEIVPTITIKSGEKVAGSEITYLVIAYDKAGNSKQCEYSFVVIGDNQAYITFDINGGSSFNKQYQAITINQNYSIDIPTKADYTFMGWYDNNGVQYTDRKGNSVKQFTAIGEYALTAHWEINYLITYELNGGQFDVNYPTSYTADDEVNLVVPVKTGYDFIGWTGSNGTTPQTNVTIALGSSGDKSYTANWSIAEYNISYTLNGGTINGTNPNKYTIQSGDITLLNPTRTGYTFAGWTGSNGNTAQMEVVISSGSIGNKNYVTNWTPIEYTIAYELNGGNINGTNPTTYTIESNDITLINPTRDYYNYVGWTGSNGNVPQTNVIITSGSYGNKTYTANWSPINYTISYDLDCGLVETSNPTSYNIETETFTLVAPIKTGYTFIGWTGSNGTSPQTVITINCGSNGNKSYTANWEAIEYTITYNLNGGAINGTNPVKYTIESDTFTLINPTKDCYVFVGWTGSNGTTPQTSITINKGSIGNKTYTANWDYVGYSINYILGGGTNNSSNPDYYNVDTDTFVLLAPTKTGYTFIGWTGSNGTIPQTSVTITKGSFGDKTYTANWEVVEYTITYNLNGGEINGINPTTYTIESNDITLINPTRDYYDFVGWTGSNGLVQQNYVSISKGSSGNKNYTANWTPVQYSISYIIDGGVNNEDNPDHYDIESDDIFLYEPYKIGYTFVGWTGSNGTIPQTSVTIAQGNIGNKSYIANWEIVNYTIEYNLNGGSVNGIKPTTYTINSSAITLINPNRTGYTFAGWTGSNGSTKQTNVIITSGSYGNKTYTANWTPIQYSITYNLDGGTNSSSNYSYYTIETARTIYNPTKTGYTFLGWTGSNGTTPQTSVIIAKGSTGNKLYTANWAPIQYSITYNLNGGSVNGTNPTTYIIDNDNIVLINPTRDYYTFVGWTGSNGSTPQLSVTIASGSYGNMTFIANWKLTDYIITYNLNGGSVNGINPTTYTIESSSIQLINPTRNGYTFAGWTGSNGTTPQTSVIIAKGSTGNKLYTANWAPIQYSITYNLNGGSVSGTNPTIYTTESSNITLLNPTMNGYDFVGWTGSNGSTPQTSVTIASGSYGNKTYTANWGIANYSITYNLNGGKNLNSINSFTINDLNIDLNEAYKNDYYFDGWYTEETFENKIESISNSLNYVLYAKFIEANSELQYTSNSSGGYSVRIADNITIENLYIPSYHNNKQVTEIATNGFDFCKISNVYLPNTIKTIGYEAFYSCDIKNITLPKSLETIGYEAFSSCDFTTINIPKSVTSISNNAFVSCFYLQEIIVEQNNEKYISIDGILYDINIQNLICYPQSKKDKDYIIPNTVQSLNSYSIWGQKYIENLTLGLNSRVTDGYILYGMNNLKNIFVNSNNKYHKSVDGILFDYGMTEIIRYPQKNVITNYIVPNTVKTISKHCFSNCKLLTSLEITNNVTTIGENAFSSCGNLSNVIIANSVKTINEDAFSYCTSLVAIIIPNSVTTIKSYAFEGCKNLIIYCEATSKPTTGWYSSWNYTNCPVYWYGETQPTTSGNYWHYVNDEVVIW